MLMGRILYARFLTALSAFLLIPSGTLAENQPDLVVCEDARVALGQSKQQVQNALAVCCRLKNAELDKARIISNELLFEASRTGGGCSGTLLFDSSERLVFAQRDFADLYGESSSTGLAEALIKGISGLLQSPGAQVDENLIKIEHAELQLLTSARSPGSQKVVFIVVNNRILRVQLDDSGRDTHVQISQEIGDLKKADLRSLKQNN